MKLRKCIPAAAVFLALLTAGCSAAGPKNDSSGGTADGYTKISQEEAREMMSRDDGHLIVDVRRQDEYAGGHIPGAVCIPNESIGETRPPELPDPDQVLLIYCRSGNRSKQAAKKLAALGYTQVYEFGGINSWTGETETGEQALPESREATETTQTEKTEADTAPAAHESTETAGKEQQMKLRIGTTEVPVIWEENASVEALKALCPLTIPMSMYGGFEQVGSIGQSIVRNDQETTTRSGDIVLYAGNQIVIFYGSNSWAYTRLGRVDLPAEEMKALLGNGDVEIRIGE